MRARAGLTVLFAVGALVAVGSPAKADFVKWYTGGAGYGGPFNGPGTVYSNTRAGAATNCPTGFGGCGGADIVATPQVYNSAGGSTVQITVDASGVANSNPWADFQPAFGGM